MSRHYEFIETAKRLAKARYGRSYDSEKDANAELINGCDLSSSALLALLGRCEQFIAALVESEIKQRYELSRQSFQDAKDEWLSEQEKLHGPIPDDLHLHLRREQYRAFEDACFWSLSRDRSCHFYPEPPEKGSSLRKQWDKWKRRTRRSNRGTAKE